MGKKVYTNSELKIIEKVYKLYIKYLKNIITEISFKHPLYLYSLENDKK